MALSKCHKGVLFGKWLFRPNNTVYCFIRTWDDTVYPLPNKRSPKCNFGEKKNFCSKIIKKQGSIKKEGKKNKDDKQNARGKIIIIKSMKQSPRERQSANNYFCHSFSHRVVARHVLAKQSMMQNASLKSGNIIESDNPSEKSREVVLWNGNKMMQKR